MISKASANATLEEVRSVPLKRPERAAGRWQGVKHGDLVDNLIRSAMLEKLKPEGFLGHLTRCGADLTCSFLLPGMAHVSTTVPAMGLVASNARRRALCFFIGGVDPDGTVIITGDFLGGKYEIGFDVAEEAQRAIEIWMKRVRVMDPAISLLKDMKPTRKEVDSILFNAGRAELVPWTKIGKVDRLYQEAERKSGWDLLKAFCQVCGNCPAQEQMYRILRFSQLLPIAKIRRFFA